MQEKSNTWRVLLYSDEFRLDLKNKLPVLLKISFFIDIPEIERILLVSKKLLKYLIQYQIKHKKPITQNECVCCKIKVMKRFLVVVLLSLLLTQFSCSSNFSIKGQVLDSQLNPIESVKVTFVVYKISDTEMSANVKVLTETDKNGYFELPISNYEKDKKLGLVVEKEGYKIETISFTEKEILNHREAFDNYQIILKKDE